MEDFTIGIKRPFRLDLTVSALRRLPINALDRWDGREYTRVLVVHNAPVEVSLSQPSPPEEPRLLVKIKTTSKHAVEKSHISAVVGKMLGLDVDLLEFYSRAESDKRLGALLNRFRGLRPPRFASTFEALINAFACQQLSLAAGIHLLNRLCEKHGLKYRNACAFPRPVDLMRAKIPDLMKLGFSKKKAEYIVDAAKIAVRDKWTSDQFADLDNESALKALRSIRGVGIWSAEYVLLRGLGRLDVIPADDVGIQNKLKFWLKLKKTPDSDATRKLLSRWGVFKGVLYFWFSSVLCG